MVDECRFISSNWCHLVDYLWNEGHVIDEWRVIWLTTYGLRVM